MRRFTTNCTWKASSCLRSKYVYRKHRGLCLMWIRRKGLTFVYAIQYILTFDTPIGRLILSYTSNSGGGYDFQVPILRETLFFNACDHVDS
jgi:hypothetical protein